MLARQTRPRPVFLHKNLPDDQKQGGQHRHVVLERRIGELSRRPTLKFNGYEEQVAYLYDGMDLRANF